LRCAVLITFLLLRSGCSRTNVPATPGLPQAAIPASSDDPLSSLARKVFDLGNRERRLHGVPELVWSDALAGQARQQSMSMMERGVFSHADPVRGALSERLRTAGIPWSRCGENIFRERGLEEPAEAAVDGWMRSTAHRESLLDPRFTHSGVGIAISLDTEYFITQDFIRPPG
jgi:uncharacterized protein YkwD